MTVSVTNLPAIQTAITFITDLIDEYAWHKRNCASVDDDGELLGLRSLACDCGYDEALDTLNTLRIRPVFKNEGAS